MSGGIFPSPLARGVRPAAEAKASRPAVTPQLRPNGNSKSARGVVRHAGRERRDE